MAFKPPAPTPPGLFRRMPPAVFPVIMGLFGLGLGWRRAADSFAISGGIGEAILGATTLLFVFSFFGYGAKLARRPRVIVEELRVLPGRAGVAAAVLCCYLLSMTLVPYSVVAAYIVLMAGFALHAILVALLVHQFVTSPPEQRRVTPVWHLTFVGFIVGALAATTLELYVLALVLFLATALVAALIWLVSLEQIFRDGVPSPLRPLLSIHLSPVALLGLVAEALELHAVSLGCAGIAAFMLAWFSVRIFWLTESGFSPLWGAFTFPLAATANLWLVVGWFWRVPGGVLLVAATLIVPAIAFQMLRLWARGQLAIKTNAATA
ncbi:tellurium resistance protein [Defluviimonas sp. D31]|uniref:SLAC1 family transporter n=1 Tax=Defluviimonas sp. D31 TaxID=3083253 RepID=UPI00296E4B32|nr:tellurium resistance protein [Defluviimonas sp. D31]MDW4547816.1 tellurium resistance protein [Defluviimonas sp. D31]